MSTTPLRVCTIAQPDSEPVCARLFRIDDEWVVSIRVGDASPEFMSDRTAQNLLVALKTTLPGAS